MNLLRHLRPFASVISRSSGNRAGDLIDAQNDRTLNRIRRFRMDYKAGAATFKDFSVLKHEYPYFGFVPCRAGDLEFVLFHANDDVVAWEYLWFGADHYERDIVKTWIEWCRRARVIYDIGGYTGLMSVLAALAASDSTVHLFEPMARTIERANINTRANRVDRRIRLHNRAASRLTAEATINLYREPDFLGTGNSIYDKKLPVLDVQKIRCVSIDEHLPKEQPDLVKIDVEGHELEAIKGMIETITRARPKMLIEMWQHTRDELIKHLNELGYRCEPFEETDRRVVNFMCVPD